MDREAWHAVIHGVAKSRTRLSDWTELNWIKPMVFPVVMYGCESQTIKKAECRSDAFQLWCWRSWESLGLQGDQTRNPKGNQSWIFTGKIDAKAEVQNFGHLMQRIDSLVKTLMVGKIEGRRRKGQQSMKLSDGITDMSLRKLLELVMDREAWRVNVHGVTKCQTWLCEWTELN